MWRPPDLILGLRNRTMVASPVFFRTPDLVFMCLYDFSLPALGRATVLTSQTSLLVHQIFGIAGIAFLPLGFRAVCHISFKGTGHPVFPGIDGLGIQL